MSAASRGPERNPPPAGAQIGPDGNLGTGCSGTAAKDSELSNLEEAAAAEDAAAEVVGDELLVGGVEAEARGEGDLSRRRGVER